MKLLYGGEDDVTKLIARRLAIEIAKDAHISVQPEDIGIRERGSAILKKLPQIVALGKKYPIVFVFDSDGECVLEILNKACPDGWNDTYASLNIAIDEGESWLLSDLTGFGKYFGIDVSDITSALDAREITFPYKTSLYIMKELVPKSAKKDVVEKMSCTERGKKPPTYNELWKDYIDSKWDIKKAMQRCESLERAIRRIKRNLQRYVAADK